MELWGSSWMSPILEGNLSNPQGDTKSISRRKRNGWQVFETQTWRNLVHGWSKTYMGVAAGFYGSKHKDSCSLRLVRSNTVFEAKMYVAIKRCAEELSAAGKKGTTIWIWSNNQVVVKALEKPIANSSLIRRTKVSLEELEKRNRMNLNWMKRKWKRLAKKGTII